MPQYLLSVYQPDGDPPPPEVLDPIMENVQAWNGELRAAGDWVFTGRLHPASTATVVRAGLPRRVRPLGVRPGPRVRRH